MAFDVKVPAVGESVQEGEVYKWHKKTGDYVELDDVLVELETDKATVEIVAEASGVIETSVAEGDTVHVGDLLARIDTEAQKPAGSPAAAETPPPPPTAGAGAPSPSPSPAPAVAAVPPPPPGQAAGAPLSPAVARMATETGINPDQLAGSGRGGRVTKTDMVNAMEGNAAKAPAPAPAPSAAPAPVLTTVPGGRGVRREKMSRLRQRIAERLVEAQQTAAMLTTFNEVDMTGVMAMRRQYKDSFKEHHGIGLGFMSFFVKAAVEALKAYPAVNGYVEGQEIVFHDYCDIGVAVSTPKGLMVPVLRDCETLSFAGVEQAIMNYAVKARDGKISLDDLSGGTFTISNGGVFGSLMSTPILNPPQSAILGMHKIQERPMVIDGKIEARPMMYLALSYDHRIVDGKEAVSFLVKIKDMVEDPGRLLLGV